MVTLSSKDYISKKSATLDDLKIYWLTITIIIDLGLTILALISAHWLRGYFPAGIYLNTLFTFSSFDKPLYFPLTILIPAVICVWLVVFSALSIYDVKLTLNQHKHTQPIFIGVTGAMLVFAGLAYFFLRDLSRFLFLYFYLLDVILLISWRKLVLHLFFKKSKLFLRQPQYRILVVGQDQLAQDVMATLKASTWSGLEIVGFAGDNPGAICTLNQVPSVISKLAINEVILALPPGYRSSFKKLVSQLQSLPVNLRLAPGIADLALAQLTSEDFVGWPIAGAGQPAITFLNLFLKRVFDIVVSGLLLILTLPFCLVIALLIKLTSEGPIFYSSQRVGARGKFFNMHKFRTMVEGADKSEIDLFIETRNGTIGGFKKVPDDPRITRIGRFLRRTSLDELPQIFNVLMGDMSLVGPRPELPWLVENYELWQYRRLMVPQGMTGWWQITDRDKQERYDLRIKDDLHYIHNYSFFLDLHILWRTIGVVFRGNAF